MNHALRRATDFAFGDGALDTCNKEEFERDEGIFETNGDQAAFSCEGDVFGVMDVKRTAVGDENSERFEGPGGEESLDFLHGHGGNCTKTRSITR